MFQEIKDSKEAVEVLTSFGLEEAEAMLYLGILQWSPIRVRALSARLGLDRATIYRCLKKLEDIPMILTTLSNPATFTAIDVTTALNNIIKKKQDDIIVMKKLAEKLVKYTKKNSQSNNSVKIPSFSIVQNSSFVFSRIAKMIQEASGIVYIVTTIDDLMRMYHTAIPEKIKVCKNNGGEVRILIDSNDEKHLPLIKEFGANEVRIGKLASRTRMIVEEGKQLIMSGLIMNSDFNDGWDSVFYTSYVGVVNNMYALSKQLWKKSKPIEKIIIKKPLP